MCVFVSCYKAINGTDPDCRFWDQTLDGEYRDWSLTTSLVTSIYACVTSMQVAMEAGLAEGVRELGTTTTMTQWSHVSAATSRALPFSWYAIHSTQCMAS